MQSALACHHCHPPPPAYLKRNCDAATFMESGEIGMGMPQAKECERLILCEAIQWSRETGYSNVLFENDTKSFSDI